MLARTRGYDQRESFEAESYCGVMTSDSDVGDKPKDHIQFVNFLFANWRGNSAFYTLVDNRPTYARIQI